MCHVAIVTLSVRQNVIVGVIVTELVCVRRATRSFGRVATRARARALASLQRLSAPPFSHVGVIVRVPFRLARVYGLPYVVVAHLLTVSARSEIMIRLSI